MANSLHSRPALRKLKQQFAQLPRRDQNALRWLGVALLAGFLYFALWLPADNYHQRGIASRENAVELLVWMTANSTRIGQLAGSGAGGSADGVDEPADGRALMGLVTSSAQGAGLPLQRFEPIGDNAVRIWLDSVPFASLAAWLENLVAGHGVVIAQAALEQTTEPGRVTARLTLGL